jgi:hypothetical protein
MSRSALIAAAIWLLAPVVPSFADDVATIDQRRAAMIRRIDERLAERWAALDVQSAPDATDTEFLRRAFLDLTGVVPRVSEVREFLADARDDKRARWIDRLLASPAHATHLATTWRNIVLPGGVSGEQVENAVGVQNWLRSQFVENMRYDRIVADFLVATGGGQTGPALYYTSLELQPEKLAASIARIFLGLQIECAQCHDHPFDRWKQRDFWGYAAFFARLEQPRPERGPNMIRLVDLNVGEVRLPNTDTIVPPKYPGGAAASEQDGGTRRAQLSIWMASRDNPYLARAAVNRAWAQLFGRGLVEPVDDLGPHNVPSHPQLLDELAAYFVATGFDLRELFRTLANTRAYRLSSQSESEREVPPELFARMAVKPLTAEQRYDSLQRTLARRPADEFAPGQASGRLFDPRRLAFIAKMESLSRTSTEYQAGVPQALTLMNGTNIDEATDIERSGLLAALEAPLFSDEDRVEVLMLATLSRPPTPQERTQFFEYVTRGGSSEHSRRALSDLLWALLNSAEFALNH